MVVRRPPGAAAPRCPDADPVANGGHLWEPGSQNRVKLRQRVIGRDRGRPMQAKRRIIRYQVYKKVCRDQVWVQLLSGYNIETYTTSSSLNLKRSPSQGRPASGLPSLNPPLKAYRLGQIRPPSSIPFTRCGARLLHPRVSKEKDIKRSPNGMKPLGT